MSDKRERPVIEGLDVDDVLVYLDELRESGETNMFGAPAYLEVEFSVTKQEARALFWYWTDTFHERHLEDGE